MRPDRNGPLSFLEATDPYPNFGSCLLQLLLGQPSVSSDGVQWQSAHKSTWEELKRLGSTLHIIPLGGYDKPAFHTPNTHHVLEQRHHLPLLKPLPSALGMQLDYSQKEFLVRTQSRLSGLGRCDYNGRPPHMSDCYWRPQTGSHRVIQ